MDKTIGLYIHIPFCKKKCAYCDFCSYEDMQALIPAYVDGLICELSSYRALLSKYVTDTIYIGGGTPSMLPPDDISRLLSAVRESCNVSGDAEITMEVNPQSGLLSLLLAAREGGVNRLSIGLQSAVDLELQALGRLHDVSSFERCYSSAREIFENISIDLMFAIPGQTAGSFSDSLDFVIDKNPEHISVYSLKIEEGTPFYLQRDKLCLPDEDTDAQMYDLASKKLSGAGYLHYEISNFAKEHKRSRHNMRYWGRREYLGIGCSAHSYAAGERFSNTHSINEYLSRTASFESAVSERLTLSPEDEIFEYIMLRLRLCDGIDDEEFHRLFGFSFFKRFKEPVDIYKKSGHIVTDGRFISLTQEGFYVSNYILSDFLSCT